MPMNETIDSQTSASPAKAEGRQWMKKVIAAVLFALIGVWLVGQVPSVEIAWVSAILLLTIYLFVFEVLEVDVAAVSIMVLLG